MYKQILYLFIYINKYKIFTYIKTPTGVSGIDQTLLGATGNFPCEQTNFHFSILNFQLLPLSNAPKNIF